MNSFSKPATLLLVENDHLSRSFIRAVLREGLPEAQVLEAQNLSTANAFLKTHTVDCVLLDLGLGMEHGISFLNQHAVDGIVTPPTLVVSAREEREHAIPPLKAGAVGYLSKERVPDELCAAVKQVLAGGRYLSESLARLLESGAENLPALEFLSSQEYRVLSLIGSGSSVKEIAQVMGIAEKTVRTYRARLMEKLSLRSDNDIVRYAIQHGVAS